MVFSDWGKLEIQPKIYSKLQRVFYLFQKPTFCEKEESLEVFISYNYSNRGLIWGELNCVFL